MKQQTNHYCAGLNKAQFPVSRQINNYSVNLKPLIKAGFNILV